MKVYDLEGNEFEKEPVDVDECVKILGWTREKLAVVEVEVVADATRNDMKMFLTEKGIDFPANISNAKLLDLYNASKG